jgi:hypothetical protein
MCPEEMNVMLEKPSNEKIVSEILRWGAPAVSVGPVIKDTHNGICGAHQPRTSISRQNLEIGLLLALHDQGLHRLCPPVSW